MSRPLPTLSSLINRLLPTTQLSRPLPPRAAHPSLTPQISSLQLHPSLEAALHILNADLPSAHFLVRHMQAPPAVEGMLLHAILHRCEGDFANARAWAGDVRDACEGWIPKHRGEKKLGDETVKKVRGGEGVEQSLMDFVYEGGADGFSKLIDDVEKFRNMSIKRKEREEEAIQKRIKKEFDCILEWCVKKFGDHSWLDATSAFVKDSEEIRKISNNMVSGQDGWRRF
ncbi:hypothetical protein P280DRAFT_498425 [Massarina eburnea CBS 473.64]|uniref:Uncharacterized protein n=1 Tax=Massarina eburnea CBS 473.64 TaxID=1395130 RepID=A0A6A6RYQ0_9PLEO|nr:hypothetical protein P280DRAFT_498425 [Massarina eburnea CBS 473.64]